ncbi:hypothetical protein [Melissospora conviva]|uniref:hypothetical protein n=1 Tax=Melissospora conviva TaxID=3388432 RepID=UPI003C1A2FE6
MSGYVVGGLLVVAGALLLAARPRVRRLGAVRVGEGVHGSVWRSRNAGRRSRGVGSRT